MSDRKSGKSGNSRGRRRSNEVIPVVGVGASAGGLEAFTQLLKDLPADTGMGFVLVQHLDPHHESALTGLLARATSIPVLEVQNNQRVRPNHIYVIPPNVSMTIAGGVLKLTSRHADRSPHRPIDSFFESLAQEQGERAIGVVLSGTATDGTLGLEAIKAEGGITFAQNESAKYDSMPRSAIGAGVVDFVLSPQEIARELARLARHPLVVNGASPSPQPPKEELEIGGAPPAGEEAAFKDIEEGYKKILLHLRNHSGVDFSLYKSSTIRRRINRRMLLTRHDTLGSYAVFLKNNAKELDALYSDVLIGVTSFFRTPEAFETLKQKVFPQLLKQRGRYDPVRAWVLGCSTGQEAYSIAMSYAEFTENIPRVPKLQIFATDLNEAMLITARLGLYAKSLANDITPGRLAKFFVEEEGGYRVNKILREQVVFARQNVLSDPPFSRMDLISCRNLLIYLEPDMQKKIMPAFHYALRPGGFLFLGASESVGQFGDLFTAVDKKQKIFSKRPAPTPAIQLPVPKKKIHSSSDTRRPKRRGAGGILDLPEGSRQELTAQREADRLMVNQYAPPGVLINADLQIIQFRGMTGPYLEPPTGKASFDILKMARPGLMVPLRKAINKARRQNKMVRIDKVRVQQNGDTRVVNLQVIPLKNMKERSFLVLFEPTPARKGPPALADLPVPKLPSKREETRRITALESEVEETRDYLQSVQEQYEAANEELQASNEEVQSANEELQSINEELETSKEELESTNEELTTVNEEMANSNAELTRLNADLNNLQISMNTPILVLGRDLTLRRFTPAAEKLFELLATDVGRPLNRIRHNLEFPAIVDFLREVIDSVSVREREVRDRNGRWYLLRARPYFTSDNKIDGAVAVFVDIEGLKRGEQQIKEGRDYAQAIVDQVSPLIILDNRLHVVMANASFYRHFKIPPGRMENSLVFDTCNGLWNLPKLRELLEEILLRHSHFDEFEVTHPFESIGVRTLLLHGRQLGEAQRILIRLEDMTERIHFQNEVRKSEVRYRRIFETAQDGIVILDPVSRKITDANPFMTQLLGYTREEFIGKEMWQFGLLSDESASHAVFRMLQQNEPFRQASLVVRTKQGELREVEVAANLYHEQEHTLIQFNVRDVTERKRSAEALRVSEDRYRMLIEQVTDYAIFSIDPEGRATTWNKGVRRILGYEQEEFIGADIMPLIFTPEDVRSGAAEKDRALAAEHGSAVRDRWMRRKDGSRFFASGATTAVRNDAGELLGFTKVFCDLTERLRLEHERDALLTNEQAFRKQAEAANEAKDQFLATLSHEMRTPLNAIVGWISLLKRGECREQEVHEAIDVIERNTKAQMQLIEDVLDVARIVSGKMHLNLRACDLSALINAAIDVVRPAARSKEVELAAELEAPVGPMACDPARIQQVAWNLLSNAVKFTPKGGCILVTLKHENSNAVIAVSDTGQGIHADVLPFIFDRFRQGDSSSRRQFGGLGLGLSIVKHLIELHGGTIVAQSEGEGRGSTFTVTLPIRTANSDEICGEAEPIRAISEPVSMNAPPARLDGLRVLVVDDEPDSRHLVTKVLEEAGATVKSVGSAAEAMRELSRVKPQILISDLGMPEMDGFDLIRRIRAGGNGPQDLPAVALTAFAHKEDAERAIAAGFQLHVSKPVDPHDLIAMLADLSHRTRGSQSTMQS